MSRAGTVAALAADSDIEKLVMRPTSISLSLVDRTGVTSEALFSKVLMKHTPQSGVVVPDLTVEESRRSLEPTGSRLDHVSSFDESGSGKSPAFDFVDPEYEAESETFPAHDGMDRDGLARTAGELHDVVPTVIHLLDRMGRRAFLDRLGQPGKVVQGGLREPGVSMITHEEMFAFIVAPQALDDPDISIRPVVGREGFCALSLGDREELEEGESQGPHDDQNEDSVSPPKARKALPSSPLPR